MFMVRLITIFRRVVKVKRIITHPRFSGSAAEGSDLVLLQLEDSLDPQIYTPVCLPTLDESFSRRQAWVTGFGRTEQGSNSNKLLKVQVIEFMNKLDPNNYNFPSCP